MTDTQTTPAATTPTPAADTGNTSQAPSIPADRAGLEARDAELNDFSTRAPMEYRYGPAATEHLRIREALSLDETDDDGTEDESAEADDYSSDATDEAATAKGKEAADEAEPPEADLTIVEDVDQVFEAIGDRHAWATQDDPLVSSFVEMAVAQGAPQAAVDLGLRYVEQLRDERKKADATENRATKERLRREWGSSYEANVSTINAALSDMPGDFGRLLKDARLPNGNRLLNHPDFARAMMAMSRQRGNPMPDLQAEENELVALMKEDIDRFNHKMWRATGKTADARLLEIRRAKAARKG